MQGAPSARGQPPARVVRTIRAGGCLRASALSAADPMAPAAAGPSAPAPLAAPAAAPEPRRPQRSRTAPGHGCPDNSGRGGSSSLRAARGAAPMGKDWPACGKWLGPLRVGGKGDREAQTQRQVEKQGHWRERLPAQRLLSPRVQVGGRRGRRRDDGRARSCSPMATFQDSRQRHRANPMASLDTTRNRKHHAWSQCSRNTRSRIGPIRVLLGASLSTRPDRGRAPGHGCPDNSGRGPVLEPHRQSQVPRRKPMQPQYS